MPDHHKTLPFLKYWKVQVSEKPCLRSNYIVLFLCIFLSIPLHTDNVTEGTLNATEESLLSSDNGTDNLMF